MTATPSAADSHKKCAHCCRLLPVDLFRPLYRRGRCDRYFICYQCARVRERKRHRVRDRAVYGRKRKEWDDKLKARTLLHTAVRRGHVKREPCAVCGGLVVEAHHADYSKPLEVTWLCKAHHSEQHLKTAEDLPPFCGGRIEVKP